MQNAPLIIWFRRDLRLDDHRALAAALDLGRPVIPLFILDPETENLGAAAKWRLGQGIAALAESLAQIDSQLILRKGGAEQVLTSVLAETGGAGVYWQRMYDPASVARDTAVKSALKAGGFIAQSHEGALLLEPWQVETGQGGPYKVYSPFWRAIAGRDFGAPIAPPNSLPAPDHWPMSETLIDWNMGAAMQRGAGIVARHAGIGAATAQTRLRDFLAGPIGPYKEARDLVGQSATSQLSENLAWGEISPRRIWSASERAIHEGAAGAEHFRKELVWREFAYHLMHHTPHILAQNWRADWDDFPWRDDCADAERWRRGQTGEDFVDAAMREVYVTGRMHNRARMIVASYLTKHLMVNWRVGQAWFDQVLTDWDMASNAMGWQWVAGSGPDAAPYFRVFNPETQAEKFDADGRYRRYWLTGAGADEFRAAVPTSWAMTDKRPKPILTLAEGRTRALAAYSARKS